MEPNLTTLPLPLQHRSPMMKRICVTLIGRALTRKEIMREACPGGKPDSNRCYFRRIHAGYRKEVHDEARYSVILNGLVRVAHRLPNGELLYALTQEGTNFAVS